MVMFLLLPELTQVWGTRGVPCAGSAGLSPRRTEPCASFALEMLCRQNLNDVPLASE